MGWGDRSWHEVRIHGLAQIGRRRGRGGADLSETAEKKPLSSFCLTPGERIGYDYGGWRCQLCLEKVMLVERPRFGPICIGGKWRAPPEWCGSGRSYMTDRKRAFRSTLLPEAVRPSSLTLDETGHRNDVGGSGVSFEVEWQQVVDIGVVRALGQFSQDMA
nr:hypothetical protein TQ38_23050 [Novosphingobium sp. P6W]